MEHIRQAVERAKGAEPAPAPDATLSPPQPQFRANVGGSARAPSVETELDSRHLEAHRIISHEVMNPRSKPFDILRTQVLQSMDRNSWQVLGVTSPTPGCGKSVVAINLALSIARQSQRSALLVDMDMQKPQVANYLGLDCDKGLMSVLDARTDLSSALVQTRIRQQQLLVLPCEAATPNSSEWMASRAMTALLEELRRSFKPWTIIVDLPPLLTSDDVISILPQIDCVLFVTAIGSTTPADIKECNKFLDASSVVQIVANKSPEMPHAYYHYGYGKKKNRAARAKVDA